MDVFLHFDEPLPCGVDEIEDTLEEALGGIGEVTGSGVGERGANLDIVIDSDDLRAPQIASLIREALVPLRLPASSRIVIGDREFAIT